ILILFHIYTLFHLYSHSVFPYTTLFRSSPTFGFIISFIFTAYVTGKIIESRIKPTLMTFLIASIVGLVFNYMIGTNYMYLNTSRSEEHTSELQSRLHILRRLLLGKKYD